MANLKQSPGHALRKLAAGPDPVQIVGAINAYSALMAQRIGFKTLYLSGAGVANASHALPDLAITTLQDVVEDLKRITDAVTLPVLVDADTGFGNAFNIMRTVRDLTHAGAAGLHIEDQIQAKRCGHRPNKALVSTQEMGDRIKAAVDARTDADFVIMARTDALASEGMQAALDRCSYYAELGADMLFPEAVTQLEHYKSFAPIGVPVLANITEFGVTPLFSLEELRDADVSLALYPLSAFRAMNAAALKVYQAILKEGTQKNVVSLMQTRDELYDFLDYQRYEQKLDSLYGSKGAIDDQRDRDS